jgi:predicted aspartyl protease
VRYSRRSLLRQLALLGVGLGAAWWLREHYFYPTPQVGFTGGLAETGWLRLPSPGGLVELTAHVGGIGIPVVVDSGAQFSAIDRALAARLGLKEAPIPLLAFGVSGEPSLTHTVGVDLDIGPLQVRGMRAATLDLLTLSGVIRRPFAMLIGRDVLRALILDVDWPNARVRFVNAAAFLPPPEARIAATRKEGGALMAPVTIEGAAPVELMVDTGATSEIALSEKTARALGLFSGRRVTTGRSVSLGGISEDRVLRVETVGFGGSVLHDVEIQVFTPAVRGPLPAGLLGVGILKQYRAAMDLAAGVLWLTGPAVTQPRHQPGPKSVLPAPG